jgi:hypothetical protein
MKSLLQKAGLESVFDLPWCTDFKSYFPLKRTLLRILHPVGLDWALFYKFQIAATKSENAANASRLKRPLKPQKFLQDHGFFGPIQRAFSLLNR